MGAKSFKGFPVADGGSGSYALHIRLSTVFVAMGAKDLSPLQLSTFSVALRLLSPKFLLSLSENTGYSDAHHDWMYTGIPERLQIYYFIDYKCDIITSENKKKFF